MKKRIINLVVHPGCINLELKKAEAFGDNHLADKCRQALDEISKVKSLENTILVESQNLMKIIESLPEKPDCLVKIYGAYWGGCLTYTDINLTLEGIPHKLAENGYI